MEERAQVYLLSTQEVRHGSEDFILEQFAIGEAILWQARHKTSGAGEVSLRKEVALAGASLAHLHGRK